MKKEIYNAVSFYRYNTNTIKEFWIFEPAEFPEKRLEDVVVFLHGFMGTSPHRMGGWIDHLVKTGKIVIFPRYQTTFTPASHYTENALEAVGGVYKRWSHLRSMNLSVLGYSAGGNIAANFGTMHEENLLPKPKNIMCVCPGVSWKHLPNMNIPLVRLEDMDYSTNLVVVTCEDDRVCYHRDGYRIICDTIEVDKKELIEIQSAYLTRANHTTPQCPMWAYKDNTSKDGFIGTVSRPSYETNILQQEIWEIFDGLIEG